jgi:outer membrane protein OmpA-like peptidoglycan-associated protein
MRRAFVIVSACWGFLGLGCVPYSTYQQTKAELEKTKDAHADLVKMYNQALTRLAARDKSAGEFQSPLLAQLRQLQDERDQLSRRLEATPAFTEKDRSKLPGVPDEGGGFGLGEALLFDEGRNELKSGAGAVLDEIVSILRTEYPNEMVIIEGHTDNQPLDSTKKIWEYNIRLAYERAHQVFVYFLAHGIPESRMIVRSYGYSKPLDPKTQNSEEGRRQNRRVVVRRGGPQV